MKVVSIICFLFVEAVRLVKVAEGATENDIINIVKQWLVWCKDRMNTENHRIMNSENQEEVNGEKQRAEVDQDKVVT